MDDSPAGQPKAKYIVRGVTRFCCRFGAADRGEVIELPERWADELRSPHLEKLPIATRYNPNSGIETRGAA